MKWRSTFQALLLWRKTVDKSVHFITVSLSSWAYN